MWLCSWTASQVFAQAAKSARWRLSWDTGMGITSWNTYRRFHGKRRSTESKGIAARRHTAFGRLVCPGWLRDSSGGALPPSWAGNTADGFAWVGASGAGRVRYDVGFFG